MTRPQETKYSPDVASEQVLDTSDKASIQHAATKDTSGEYFASCGRLFLSILFLIHLKNIPTESGCPSATDPTESLTVLEELSPVSFPHG